LDEKQEDEIRTFLKEFNKIASTGRGIDVIPRKENQAALTNLGLTKKNRTDEIMTLSLSDYCDGPKPDQNPNKPGKIWVFGKSIGGKEVYIKLKIAQVGNQKIAKCLSFHAADYPLCFPFK
jgi:hypothetical protein